MKSKGSYEGAEGRGEQAVEGVEHRGGGIDVQDAAGFAPSDGPQKYDPCDGEGMIDQPEGA